MGERYDSMTASNGKNLLPNDTVVDVIDKYAGRVTTINDEGSKIHYGNHFVCNDVDKDIDSGSPKEWLVSHDGEDVSILFRLVADGIGFMDLFEDVTVSDAGTELDTFNSNRTSSNTTALTFSKDPSVSDDGTLLLTNLVGTSRKVGASSEGFKTLILNTSEYDYLFRFTPDNDGVQAVINIAFHTYAKET